MFSLTTKEKIQHWNSSLPSVAGGPAGNQLSRAGSVSKLLLLMVCSVMAVVLLSFAALNLRPDANRVEAGLDQVRIYCTAGVLTPVEEIVVAYNKEFGTNVEVVRTGGSGELAGQIKTEFETDVPHAADLFLSADDFLLDKAYSEGIISERYPIAQQRPVIAVRADETAEISTLRELTLSHLKFGIASERAAVGKVVRALATRDGVLDELESGKATDAENVMTLAQALAAGSLDAAVIWDTTVKQLNLAAGKDVLKTAAFVDQSNTFKSNVAIGVVSKTDSAAAARKFCRYLSESKESREAFRQFGFTVVSDGS